MLNASESGNTIVSGRKYKHVTYITIYVVSRKHYFMIFRHSEANDLEFQKNHVSSFWQLDNISGQTDLLTSSYQPTSLIG